MPTSTHATEILIVGGGSAGWMAAAFLRRRTDRQVTLVESPGIPSVGVGEATIPALLDFVRGMDLDEDAFMQVCHASYKLGIEFRGWTREDHRYFHPFGLCGGTIDGLDLFHFWEKSVRSGASTLAYSDYSLQALLASQGRAHRPINGAPAVENYAYHLDAGAFAALLQKLAVAEGVVHLRDDVVDVGVDSAGNIQSVDLASGEQLRADLYVDCTGFRGLLIEAALGDPWVDWSDQLLCDRAVVTQLPADPEMAPYTQATAQEAGWIWRIPLSNRVGSGYVYSSAHTDDETATRRLLDHAGLTEAEAAGSPRQLAMRVGRRTHFWRGNCVALGLSAGFVEPLESTGLFLIQRGLEELFEVFPGGHPSPPLADLYNRRMAEAYDEVRDFVLLHYLLTGRDEHFWRDARDVPVPASLEAAMALYAEVGLVREADRDPVFRETNYFHIYTGGERLPRRGLPRADLTPFPQVEALLTKIRDQNEALASERPPHGELMRWLHGPIG